MTTRPSLVRDLGPELADLFFILGGSLIAFGVHVQISYISIFLPQISPCPFSTIPRISSCGPVFDNHPGKTPSRLAYSLPSSLPSLASFGRTMPKAANHRRPSSSSYVFLHCTRILFPTICGAARHIRQANSSKNKISPGIR